MDPRFFQHAERVRAYTSRGVTFVRTSRSPVETILFGIVGVLLLLVVLALLIPFLLIGIAAGLIGAAVLGVKRLLSGSRAPNGHIGPVRTDGRSNVRVIDRDGR